MFSTTPTYMDALDFVKFSTEEEHRLLNEFLDKIDNDMLSYKLDGEHDVGSILWHIADAEYSLARMTLDVKGEAENIEKPELKTVDDFRKLLEKTKKRSFQTFNGLGTDKLEEIWVSPRGKEYTYKALVYHTLEHIATHRGQLLMIRRIYDERKEK